MEDGLSFRDLSGPTESDAIIPYYAGTYVPFVFWQELYYLAGHFVTVDLE